MIPDQYLEELNSALAARAEEICRLLLPAGKRIGHAWRCGGVDGGPGKSLEVELEGDKAGVWHDRATGEKGRLLKLWELNRGLPFREAVAQAADHLRLAPPAEAADVALDPWCYTYEHPPAQATPATHAPAPPPIPSPAPGQINWQACVAAFDEDSENELCEWRGFSRAFVRWLVRQEAIGIFRGRFAFPVHNQAGAVVRIHYRNGEGGWLYHPQGGGESSALVLGDPATATHTLAFESQWDAFAVLDKLEIHSPLNSGTYAAYITRGANSNTDIGKLRTHQIIACPQNDPPEKASKSTGRTPAEEWLHRLSQTRPKGIDFKVFETPAKHKDANDWIREEKPDLYTVFQAVIERSASPTDKGGEGGGLARYRVDHGTTLGMSSQEIEALRPPYIIDWFLRHGELMLLGAESKSRKSWLAQDAAFCVGAGLPWLADENNENGFSTTQGRVYVLDLELNRSEVLFRFARARANRFPGDHEMQEKVTAAVESYSFDGLNALAILKYLEEIKPTVKPGDLVIVDCLYRLEPDGNEAKLVAETLEKLKLFAAETKAGMIVVDHFRKAGDDKARNRFAGTFIKQASASTLVAIEVMEDDVLVLNIDARTFQRCPRVHARFDPQSYGFRRVPEAEVAAAKNAVIAAKDQEWLVAVWRSRALDYATEAAEAGEKWSGISRQSASKRLTKLVERQFLVEIDPAPSGAKRWQLTQKGAETVRSALNLKP